MVRRAGFLHKGGDERFVRVSGRGGRKIITFKRRFPNFLSSAEIPPVNKDIEARLAALKVVIADVDERFILGSGHGGQKLQKTSSCVWLRHRPTGVETRCQRERSQTANRELAWAELCRKLEERQRAERAQQTGEREQRRRRNRQKSRGQKIRMIQSKKHRAGIKARRGRPDTD
jgi:protein subunit release factor B